MYSLSILTRKLHLSFHIIGLLISVAIGLFSCQAYALSNETLFQHARDAYAGRNESALAEDAKQLHTQQYVLAPYADYWLMLLKLEQARDEDVQNFLAKYIDLPFTERLRGEWMKKLAKQGNWQPFFEEYADFQRDDVTLQCYALLGHAQIGDVDVIEASRSLWMTTVDLPSNCNALFDLLQKTGALSTDDIWARFRLALLDGKPSLARAIATRLNNIDTNELKWLEIANQTPQVILEVQVIGKHSNNKKDVDKAMLKTRFGNELYLFALDRLARTKLEDAISLYSSIQGALPEHERADGWGRIAYHAARAHHPQALEFYALAVGAKLEKEQLAWQVRAALRAEDWPRVLTAIAAMPAKQMDESSWRYWRARALRATAPKNSSQQVEANVLFSRLSTERHYYGWLAADELDSSLSNAEQSYVNSELEVTAVANHPAIKRAIEFQRLDMRWEAKSEWVWATRNFDDQQLLAAAEFASRQKWYDIAISTADNTRQLHDYKLRYPTPYRDLIHTSANNAQVDEAWVYGLTRQESRFMHYAKSNVGASGLMQLMPATAKWAAHRMGMRGYHADMIHNLGTNIDIGTYYMRHTLDLMDGQAVMATAAYNAGPSRAKQWMAKQPLEAAIYIETIPFFETRNYVQKVMANANFYAPRLGTKVQTLKSRLGIIPARAKAEVITAEIE